jgi:phenylacetate-coenzyme A ligase PaaK-like adenylate-forming protein
MKFILLILVLAFSAFTFQEDVVQVEFTNKNTFDDLVQIRAQLAEKGISLDYTLIQFENNKLKALAIRVDCHDGFSGSGKSMDLKDKDRIAVSRDYRKGATEPFFVEVIRAD